MSRLTLEQYSRFEKAAKFWTILFTWGWMLAILCIAFATGVSQLILIALFVIGFLPYLLFYNGYVRGTVWKRVMGADDQS
jgi:hypothetical protein